ncbi:DNA mismatch repair protein MutS [Methylobacterium sp. Leaf123]|uniref:Smr/MutS family protein n=1 Tax=Methylobacterium sp. Leaf123 TaxID=1736264 RepID=UPI0007007D81|nr:Smr/MutS family protein [Methylobacterium sp. Leaf123]KQQ12115.1 DNA mismatch repair protein MutS [Methylobacterium sp. Leaf123]
MSARPPRRSRLLSREEAHLWGEIAKLITPLRGRAKPKKVPAAAAEQPAPPIAGPAVKVAKPAPKPAAKPVWKPASPPPAKPVPLKPAPAVALPRVASKPLKLGDLAPEIARASAVSNPPVPPASPGAPGLERRERRGLERGTLTIEARIDLHGLYQAEAHAALVGFLLRSRAAGHARVLVVTGKGGEDFGGRDRGGFSERGVLRRSVPHWLRGPELRGLVLGFEEAARHHGGGGALYVRLRRR